MTTVGELIAGRYRIVFPLAVGGLGRVWLAHDEALDERVALKQCRLPDGLTPEQQALVRRWTLRDAHAFARVRHPHLIRVLDVLPGAEAPWLVMEYLPSRSLLQVIQESGALPPHRVATIGLALLGALSATARAGLLHLDVKPGNVLVADDGRVALTDFGPAVTDEGVRALAAAGIILGSPKYVAPERLSSGTHTLASDLWSLGATLYHAVEGRPPYARPSTEETLRAIAAEPPDPPRRAGPLTPALRALLQRDPADRPSLARAQELLRGTLPAPPSRVRVRPRGRRRSAALATAFTAVVTFAVSYASAATRRDEPAPERAAAVAPAIPGGFGWFTDPRGFRVAVPAGWRLDRPGEAVRFTAPAGLPVLRISPWRTGGSGVVPALLDAERDTALAGYRRIRIEPLPQAHGAVWEYTFVDRSGRSMRGLRRVTGSGAHAYLIEWQAPRQAWAAQLQQLAVVLESFGR